MPGRLVFLPLYRGEIDLGLLSFLQLGISPDAHQGFGQLRGDGKAMSKSHLFPNRVESQSLVTSLGACENQHGCCSKSMDSAGIS